MAVFIILYNFDSFENMRVIDGHDCYFFHIEQVLCDLIIDGFEVNDFDGDGSLIGDTFSLNKTMSTCIDLACGTFS